MAPHHLLAPSFSLISTFKYNSLSTLLRYHLGLSYLPLSFDISWPGLTRSARFSFLFFFFATVSIKKVAKVQVFHSTSILSQLIMLILLHSFSLTHSRSPLCFYFVRSLSPFYFLSGWGIFVNVDISLCTHPFLPYYLYPSGMAYTIKKFPSAPTLAQPAPSLFVPATRYNISARSLSALSSVPQHLKHSCRVALLRALHSQASSINSVTNRRPPFISFPRHCWTTLS